MKLCLRDVSSTIYTWAVETRFWIMAKDHIVFKTKDDTSMHYVNNYIYFAPIWTSSHPSHVKKIAKLFQRTVALLDV